MYLPLGGHGMYQFKTAFIALSVAFAPVDLSAQTSPITVLQEGFENGLGNWRASGNTTAATTTAEAKSGRYSVKMKLGPTDKVVYRTEIVPNQGGVFNVGTEYCIKASLKLKNWTSVPNWMAIFQTHAVPGNENWNCVSGRNSISLTVRKDQKIGLHVIKQPRRDAGTSGAALADFAYAGAFSYDKWHNFVFRYRPSFSSDGIIEAWQDGNKVYQQFGGNVDLYDRCGKPAEPWTYLKVGLYKDAANTGTQEIYYDDIVITKGTNACGTVISQPQPQPEPVAGFVSKPEFQNRSFTPQTKDFSAEIELTPLNSTMDGVLSLSTAAMAEFNDGAILVRMSSQGIFDVRKGAAYAFDSSVPYVAGSKYKVNIAVNMTAKTYTVRITGPDGKTNLVAKDYQFRSTQATAASIGNLSIISLTGQFRVDSADLITPVPLAN
jgi:hypothetical protein